MSTESVKDQVPVGVVLTAGNEPFKSKASALAALAIKKMEETHEVHPYGDGFAIFPKPEQPPASDEQSAETDLPPAQAVKPEVKPAAKGKMRFFIVRFHDKSNANDPDDVQLSHNGVTLVIQRMKDVVLPESYVECADHATFPQWRQMPGEPRKVVGHIKIFPFDLKGEATEADFIKLRREGTLRTREEIARQSNLPQSR